MIIHRLGFFVRAGQAVYYYMFSTRNNLQIFQSIIKSVFINMMNYFRRNQFAPKMFFHNYATAFYMFSLTKYKSVPFSHKASIIKIFWRLRNFISIWAPMPKQSSIMFTAKSMSPAFVSAINIRTPINFTYNIINHKNIMLSGTICVKKA